MFYLIASNKLIFIVVFLQLQELFWRSSHEKIMRGHKKGGWYGERSLDPKPAAREYAEGERWRLWLTPFCVSAARERRLLQGPTSAISKSVMMLHVLRTFANADDFFPDVRSRPGAQRCSGEVVHRLLLVAASDPEGGIRQATLEVPPELTAARAGNGL